MKKTEYFISNYNSFYQFEVMIKDVTKKRDEWIQENIDKIGKIDLEKLSVVNSDHQGSMYAIISLTYYPKE